MNMDYWEPKESNFTHLVTDFHFKKVWTVIYIQVEKSLIKKLLELL